MSALNVFYCSCWSGARIRARASSDGDSLRSKISSGSIGVARWIFVSLITALLSACGGADAPGAGERSGETWSAEQLQAFEQFKSNVARRAAVAETVARSFPAAFNGPLAIEGMTDGAIDPEPDNAGSISQPRLVELLGRPSVSFSLVERPEYLGTEGPPLDFDPRELHILLYDIDCLAAGESDVCSHLEAIALKQRILRVRLLQARRQESVALLSQPSIMTAARQEDRRLIPEMPQAGWSKVPRAGARKAVRAAIARL